MSRLYRAIRYARNAANIAVEFCLLSLVAFLLCAALLYLGDMFWFLYLETPMGQKFLTSFREQSRCITEILSYDIIGFSADLTLAAAAVCVIASACSRVLHISRHFYLSFGFFGKLCFWGGPLTAAVTCYIREAYALSDYRIVSVFAAIPTFCLFMSCFKYMERLLPEIVDIARPVRTGARRAWAWSVMMATAAGDENSPFPYEAYIEKTRKYFNRQVEKLFR